MKRLSSFLIALLSWASLVQAADIPRADPEPFFSEYVEGATSKGVGDLALEIFNPTLQQIDFDTQGYFVQIFADGSLTPTAVIALSGILDPGGCFVLVASSASPGLQALANQIAVGLVFDGNDLIVLGFTGAKGSRDTYLDAIGQLGNDPTPPGYWGSCPLCTADVDLRRDPSVSNGDIDINDLYSVAAGWEANPANDWTDLGSHIPSPVELMSFVIE